MKSFVPSFAVLAAALFLTLPVARAGDPIPVDTEKPLQVVVHDNIVPRSRDSWTSPRLEHDRYLEIETAVEQAMKAAGYKGKVKVTQFAANIPESEQRLNLFLYRWEKGLESFGASFTAEFTMEAVLVVDGREYELGSFSARESHVAMGGPTAEDYRPAARRAIDQMIEFYRNAIAAATPKR
ncbi:MAG: hypothetical protein IAE82_15895 [Opitutaceae bacterium]|nr:hypothetical protein [Opitutaceae bacterium]